MKKVIIILLGIIVYCSCQDDNNSNRVKPEVSFLIFRILEIRRRINALLSGDKLGWLRILNIVLHAEVWTDAILMEKKI